MVLFGGQDYEQGARIDTTTTNVSFLRMAILLNKMGVKNNKFFLSIFDKDLIGKDPHNLNDDSIELRQRIGYECKINFWYFIREVVRVVASGTDGIPYILNRANLAQAWLFLNSIDGFLVMPRQIGKTIGMICICLWYLYIAGKKLSWGMFCQGSMLQWDNVKRLKELRDALPKYLWLPSVADSNNKEGVSYAALDNHLQTFIAQSDKQAADRQGRGQSLAVESWDEIAYYVNNVLSWPSATAAMNTAGPLAKESGLPSAKIITTTAGDIDDPWGKFAYKMVCDCMRFTEKLYDCKDRPQLMDIIRANSKNNIVYMEYNYKQLGKSEEWFEDVTRAKDPKVVEKDYLNHWLHGSDASLFTKEMLDKIQSSRKEPVTTTWYESMYIRWYQDPDTIMKNVALRNKPYVIGSDTSDNVMRDYSTMCMVDPYDCSVVCTFKCNTTNLMFVAQCIAKMLIDFPRAIFIPERNKNGAVFLDYVFIELRNRGLNPLTKIYNKFFQEYTRDTNVTNLDYNNGAVRKEFGFTTSKSATSREFLYSSVLMTALKLAGDRLYDSGLIDEISGLTTRNGRVDHPEVGHDDLLIAYLLACYFILFGMNHQLYGVTSDEFLCNVRNDGAKVSSEEKKQYTLMCQQIVELKQKIKRCSNPVLLTAFNRELQRLTAVVGDVEEISEDVIKPMDQLNKESAHNATKHRTYDPMQLFTMGVNS